MFPVVKLQLAEDDPFEGRPTYDEPAPALPEAPGDAPEWEVEAVLDAKMRWKSLWYMVSFKGYDTSHNQWVKHSDVFALEAITEFYRNNPAAPRTIAITAFDSLPFRDPTLHVRSMRRGAAFQGGGDVRGTRLRRISGPARPSGPARQPPGSDSGWHVLCDRARDICRSLRSRGHSQ